MSQKDFFSQNQNYASNPANNVWVQANAGTGKTTVLIRRLLRILFRSGCNDAVSGILCLTYTNAAAGEMRNRILADLRKWAMATDSELTELLDGISENTPVTTDDLIYARNIFYTYIDNPEMLKIKTIHSFCEEILHRFPLEAGVSPAWSLISGSAQTVLLQEAFEKMIKSSFDNKNADSKTIKAFNQIIKIKSEHFIKDLRELLLSRYKSFFQSQNSELYRQYFINEIRRILNVSEPINMASDIEYLKQVISYLENLKNNTKKPAQYIDILLNNTKQYIDNTINFDVYKNAYLTKENQQIKNVLKHDILLKESKRVFDTQQYLLNKQIFDNTMALFDLSMDFASVYKKLKNERNVLDFDDLILYTQYLFSKPDVMGWVLSQLDISLSHILVDEAQDTSPQQWNILRMLAGDFFTDGETGDNRSIFVVGDTKQSIYGFQNADPYAFAESREAIAEQIKQNYRTIQEIGLDQSFRSVEPILKTVDYFFDDPDVIKNTNFHNNKHVCFRKGEQGFVELHALSTYDVTGIEKTKRYVGTIADKIEYLIKHKRIDPKDIMVLVQKRNPFVDPLSNVLKKRGINIAGNDRINLPEFPAIKDMLYTIRFCLNQNDDYSLCYLLKSPFYRLKEEDIFYLCNIKNKSENATIFDVLKQEKTEIYSDIIDTIEHSKNMAPYSFFTYLLNKNDNRKKIISALGKQIIDPLEEFLTMCLAYERTQSGTLYHFFKWFVTGDSEIKRDMDASQGVRIMTVHGSKGLASPIVFLIDTLTTPKTDALLNVNHLHKNPNYDVWLWKTNDTNIVQKITDKNKSDAIAEYYRLLYVAMTRTRDKLYIYGCDTDRISDISWHAQLWKTLSNIKDAFVDDKTIRITNDTKFE